MRLNELPAQLVWNAGATKPLVLFVDCQPAQNKLALVGKAVWIALTQLSIPPIGVADVVGVGVAVAGP